MNLMAPFEWASKKIYTVTGYRLMMHSKAASALGFETLAQQLDDGKEFFLTAGDPTYNAAAYSAPAGKTPKQRAAASAEANRLTDNVVNNIAPNTELALTTAADVGAMAATGGLAPAAGIAKTGIIKATSYVVPVAGGLLDVPLSPSEAVDVLLAKGEAPTIKWYDKVPIIRNLLGDPHYAAGGTPDTHPARISYANTEAETTASTNNNTTTPNSQSHAAVIAKKAGGFFEMIGGFFKSAFDMVVAGVKSVAAMFTNEESAPPTPASATTKPAISQDIASSSIPAPPPTPMAAKQTSQAMGGH